MITYDKNGICTRCKLPGSGFVSDGVCMCGDVETETDYEFGCDDPALGEVSLDTLEEAQTFAAKVSGKVWVKTWKDGETVCKELID
jgi:hypothetical protein